MKLRTWTLKDIESVFHNANNVDVYKFMSDEFPNSLEAWKSFIDATLNDKEILYLAIEIDGKAVGGIGISPQKGIMRRNAELGYWLGQNYWGQGIMTKAIKEIVRLAFDKFDIDRIYAKPFAINIASQRILEKAGFVLEAKFEKTVIKNGVLLDEYIYAIRK